MVNLILEHAMMTLSQEELNIIHTQINDIKKPELHIHYRGCLTAELFYEILLKQRTLGYFPYQNPLEHFDSDLKYYLLQSNHLNQFLMELKKSDPDQDQLKKLCNDLWNYNNPDDFFRTYILTGGLSKEAHGFYPLSDHLALYLKKQNIVYCELIFSIGEYLNLGWSYEEISKILEYTGTQARNHGCELNIILDFVRNIPADIAFKRIKTIAEKNLPYVIGLTLGGDEKNFPAKDFVDLFDMAKDLGWYRTCHAGEFDGHQSIIDAVELLGAQRIAHGIAAVNSQYTMDLLKERDITLEVCPTSNIYTKALQKPITQHPVKHMIDMGLKVTIASDDPGFFNTSLTEELILCKNKLGFSFDDIQKVIESGFNASFKKND